VQVRGFVPSRENLTACNVITNVNMFYMMSENVADLTPPQSRAARALLGWSQQDLARRASVAVSTVADFERGQQSPVANKLDALKAALEKEGIRFPPGGAVFGAFHKFQSRSRVAQDRVAPIRWITESNLEQWGASRMGQELLPELIRRLVLAEAGYHPELRFPSGDSVAMHGWDGETKNEFTSPIVPLGPAGWELGTDKQPKTKADKDYAQRKNGVLHFDPLETTFVFATPRRWAKKAEWLKTKKVEGFWKDVRIIDAVDLVQWLERFPAVALWFAHLMGILPQDVETLDQIWREWSLSTRPPLSVSLVLADRDDTATRIWRWLLDHPSVFALQADAPIEAKAFLYGAIEQYPAGYRDFFHSRAIVATSAEAARALADVSTPLIIILEDAEPGLTNSLVEKGHHVFVALIENDASQGAALPRPIRYTIQDELMRMKVPRREAEILARDSARSLTILRRLMPSAPGVKTPDWAASKNARYMVPALMTGAWDENKPADRRVLENLCGLPYDDLARELTAILKQPDSPLRKIGGAWKIASPRDAWFRLAPFITSADLTKFSGLAADVLGSADPLFNLEPDERWRADLVGDEAAYSGLIRTGMAEVLVLLSAFGGHASAAAAASLHADHVVKRLLGNADAERWWSLHRDLHVLAEASPVQFLDAVDKSLTKNDPPIMKLFDEGSGNILFGGGGEHSHLLWALEVLAWSTDYLTRVTDILGRLTELDPEGRLSNRPRNTFQQIYRLWRPQTSATLDQRNVALKRFRKTYPNIGWTLLLNLYPKSHDSAFDSPVPRWRDFSANDPERATHSIIIRGAQTIGGWLLEDVGSHAKRWSDLFERFANFAPDLRSSVVQQLVSIAPQIGSDADRVVIQQGLRKLLNHHRQFPDANWVLPNAELKTVEDAYGLFTPRDKLLQIKWLFDEFRAPLLTPPTLDYDGRNPASDEARRDALADLLKAVGQKSLAELRRMVRFPSLVGRAYAQIKNEENFPPELIVALKTDDAINADFGYGGIATYYEMRGDTWADGLINQCMSERWGPLALERLLLSLPKSEHFIERTAQIGGEIEKKYWEKLDIFSPNVPATLKPRVVESLLRAHRAREAIHYAGQYVRDIPSDLLIRVLNEAVSGKPSKDGNENTMSQYYVELIFQKLDKDPEVLEDRISLLEWKYLQVLEYSNRKPSALPKLLATSPDFFVQVLSAVYRGDDEKSLDENAADFESQKAVATQAWTLLHEWTHVPGLSDGTVNGAELEAWVRNARIRCAEVGRAAIGDEIIGQVLAHAPTDDDGTWPCFSVRELIELTRSKDLESGIQVGVYNSRGVTTRLPTDGGAQERDLATRYRAWSEKTRLEFPRTSALLAGIADSYELDAKRQDDRADIQQW
jgi:transcriptional regulator with XRE-family HTH domain